MSWGVEFVYALLCSTTHVESEKLGYRNSRIGQFYVGGITGDSIKQLYRLYLGTISEYRLQMYFVVIPAKQILAMVTMYQEEESAQVTKCVETKMVYIAEW